jgi:Cu(I)/Ag(I) efflux system membrane protein CusA/SilA
VSVGFIALFGNAIETGVVIVFYLEDALKERLKHASNLVYDVIHEAIIDGATRRLRPVLMTAFASVLGLLPILFSNGVGSEMQKPLAIVVAGGLITAISATLIVIPILFAMLKEKTLKKELHIEENSNA